MSTNKDPEHARIVKAYTDLKQPGSLAGIDIFYAEYKKKYPDSKVTKRQVKEAVQSIPIYQLHVTKRRRFRRREYKLPPGSLSMNDIY